MNDLISRQAAIEAAKNLLKYHGKTAMTEQFIDYASTNAMEKIPSSVIHCNECNYNYGISHGVEFYENDIVCEYWESDGLTANDYCSMAERRKDG